MKRILISLYILTLFLFLLFTASCTTLEYEYIPFTIPEGDIQLTFSVTADMRHYTGSNIHYFRNVCEQILYGGAGDFMVSPGDIDPPSKVLETIRQYIGKDYLWYPVVGNHEAETPSDMTWLRIFNTNGNTLLNVVKVGPNGCRETTYSFDYGDTHFIVLNEYFDGTSDTGTDGDIVDALHDWLVNDLNANTNPIIFVFGHEPAYPQPDKDNGRIRHEDDSLNKYPTNRDRFWTTLINYGIKAYICGHTHNYSSVNINGVWQIDAGHARGLGDTGAKSTLVMFYVMNNGDVWFYTYRLNIDKKKWEFADCDRL